MILIKRSLLQTTSLHPKHSNKHQRFLIDVEGKYNLLEPTENYQKLLDIYSEILEKEVTDISKLTRVEVDKILGVVGYKIHNKVK